MAMSEIVAFSGSGGATASNSALAPYRCAGLRADADGFACAVPIQSSDVDAGGAVNGNARGWTGLGLALLLLSAAGVTAGAADEPKKEFPKSARLAKSRIKALPRYAYLLRKGVEVTDAPSAVSATVAQTKLIFVDVNGNGSYGDVGIDGWMPDDRDYIYMLPLEPWIAVRGGRAFLWFGPESKKLRYRFEPLAYPTAKGVEGARHNGDLGPAQLEVPQGLAAWNRLRMLNGLCPVYLDPDLTRGAMLHAIYQIRHGIGHTEEKGKKYYTEPGAASAKDASIGTRAILEEVVGVYRTFYHRIQLYHPDTRGAGVAAGANSIVIDGTRGREKRRWNWPVIIPAPGTDGVGRAFDDELPTVHDDFFALAGGQRFGGFPITLTFPSRQVTDVTAELRIGGPDGKPVPFLLSWPEKPANERFPNNLRSICLIAERNLKGGSAFWVKVNYEYRGKPGERIWTFRTARF